MSIDQVSAPRQSNLFVGAAASGPAPLAPCATRAALRRHPPPLPRSLRRQRYARRLRCGIKGMRRGRPLGATRPRLAFACALRAHRRPRPPLFAIAPRPTGARCGCCAARSARGARAPPRYSTARCARRQGLRALRALAALRAALRALDCGACAALRRSAPRGAPPARPFFRAPLRAPGLRRYAPLWAALPPRRAGVRVAALAAFCLGAGRCAGFRAGRGRFARFARFARGAPRR